MGPKSYGANVCDDAPILSYKVSVPIKMNNQKSIDQAMQFQAAFVKQFNLQGSQNCSFGELDAAPH